MEKARDEVNFISGPDGRALVWSIGLTGAIVTAVLALGNKGHEPSPQPTSNPNHVGHVAVLASGSENHAQPK